MKERKGKRDRIKKEGKIKKEKGRSYAPPNATLFLQYFTPNHGPICLTIVQGIYRPSNQGKSVFLLFQAPQGAQDARGRGLDPWTVSYLYLCDQVPISSKLSSQELARVEGIS
jgi:hypothetical protein